MKTLLITVLLSISLTACQPAYMRIDPAIANNTQILQVEGRQNFSFGEQFSFAPYELTRVSRGWKETLTIGIFHLHLSNVDQSFEFTMKTPSSIWEGQCSTMLDRNQLHFGKVWKGTLDIELDAQTYFACSLQNANETNLWNLILEQDTQDVTLKGILSNGTTIIDVRGTTELEGTSIPLSTASGYQFIKQSSPYAAVEVINEGRIWLPNNSNTSEKDLIAAASAALLLYRDFRD